MSEICIKCLKPARLMCRRCFEPYCSQECQIIDWKNHKKQCVEMPSLVDADTINTIKHTTKLNTPLSPTDGGGDHQRAPVHAQVNERCRVENKNQGQSAVSGGNRPPNDLQRQQRQQQQLQAPQQYKQDVGSSLNRPINDNMIDLTLRSSATQRSGGGGVTNQEVQVQSWRRGNGFAGTAIEDSFKPPNAGGQMPRQDEKANGRSFNAVNSSEAAIPGGGGRSCGGDISKPKQGLQSKDLAGSGVRAGSVAGAGLQGGPRLRLDTAIPPTAMLRSAILSDEHFKMTDTKAPIWQSHFVPPKSTFFEAVVQYIEGDEAERPAKAGEPVMAWLAEDKNDEAMRKLLVEINRNVVRDNPCNPGEIGVGSLVAAPFCNILYRAEVLSLSAAKGNGAVRVRLIDYGNVVELPYSLLYKPIAVMLNLQAYAFRVHFKQRPVSFKLEGNITVRLTGSAVGGDVANGGGVYYIAELKGAEADTSSAQELAMANLTRQLNQSRLVEASRTPLPPSPPETPNTMPDIQQTTAVAAAEMIVPGNAASARIFTISDLQTIPLTVGPSVCLCVTDSSELSSIGYVTAVEFTNLDVAKVMKDQLSALSKHCASPALPPSYQPLVGELCLAVFADDGSWYRAVCLKQITAEHYAVRFIDYGNIATVSSAVIRPITKELLYPSMANRCFLEKDGSARETLASVLPQTSIIKATVMERDASTYTLILA